MQIFRKSGHISHSLGPWYACVCVMYREKKIDGHLLTDTWGNLIVVVGPVLKLDLTADVYSAYSTFALTLLLMLLLMFTQLTRPLPWP